jgi:hypothetical protein
MSVTRHCRHCWGNCAGECLLPGAAGDAGLCIHRPNPPLSWPDRFRMLTTRGFWRRFFWGMNA